MASDLPLRLFRRREKEFEVISTQDVEPGVEFDIISYRWGGKVKPYDCEIPGVTWKSRIPKKKIKDIKTLMASVNIEYLWVDSICVHQRSKKEKSVEIPKMYQYYKNARKCYVLMDLEEEWDPEDIMKNLKFIDHILSNMEGTTLTPESDLTENMIKRLSEWENGIWKFPLSKSTAEAAAIDMGVLNCYSTCINRVKSIFMNEYFTRVWTFQEMLLGKNITLYGTKDEKVSYIGQLESWMDLATSCKDKAYKLREWIEKSRHQTPTSVLAVLKVINDDYWALSALQVQVLGIASARMDIITGGPSWWHENYKGVSNVLSAACITPRRCERRGDLFRGLLGVFSGLFTPEEVREKLMSGEKEDKEGNEEDDATDGEHDDETDYETDHETGNEEDDATDGEHDDEVDQEPGTEKKDDMAKISYEFFKQLSIKTKFAWTKLAVCNDAADQWGWTPVVPNGTQEMMTTDCFSGVIRLGKLGDDGEAKTKASTGLSYSPRRYMKIKLKERDPSESGFKFVFRGCNCGGKSKRWYSRTSEEIPPQQEHPTIVAGDETGRVLLQCATTLGSLMDPSSDVVEFRRRLLVKLRPYWKVSDPSAKTADWIDRCVSGTDWERPDPDLFKVHNRSMNFDLRAVYDCGSRLQNQGTANVSCTVKANCGCKIIAPFSFVFSAITAVSGSSLGDATASLDEDTGRITISDGLGLVQMGQIDKPLVLVAFAGDVKSYSADAKACRTTKLSKPVTRSLDWPKGRALLREDVHESLRRLPSALHDLQDLDMLGGLAEFTPKADDQASEKGSTRLADKFHMPNMPESLTNLPSKMNMQGMQEGFSSLAGIIRMYGCVKTNGSGNLLIYKKGLDAYKIVGACIDEDMANMWIPHEVTIK